MVSKCIYLLSFLGAHFSKWKAEVLDVLALEIHLSAGSLNVKRHRGARSSEIVIDPV